MINMFSGEEIPKIKLLSTISDLYSMSKMLKLMKNINIVDQETVEEFNYEYNDDFIVFIDEDKNLETMGECDKYIIDRVFEDLFEKTSYFKFVRERVYKTPVSLASEGGAKIKIKAMFNMDALGAIIIRNNSVRIMGDVQHKIAMMGYLYEFTSDKMKEICEKIFTIPEFTESPMITETDFGYSVSDPNLYFLGEKIDELLDEFREAHPDLSDNILYYMATGGLDEYFE